MTKLIKGISDFNAEGEQVRCFADDEGFFWFCMVDVCKKIGYKHKNDALKYCSIADARLQHPVVDNLGRYQNATFIREDNLNLLLVRTRVPKAEPFAQFVAQTIMRLRRDGKVDLTTEEHSSLYEAKGKLQLLGIEAIYNRLSLVSDIDPKRLVSGYIRSVEEITSCDAKHLIGTALTIEKSYPYSATDLGEMVWNKENRGKAMNNHLINLGVVYRNAFGKITPTEQWKDECALCMSSKHKNQIPYWQGEVMHFSDKVLQLLLDNKK